MATENGTNTSIQDPAALGGGAPAELKGKGKAAATEDVEDTSMAVVDDDDDDDDEDEEAEEVCLQLPRITIALY